MERILTQSHCRIRKLSYIFVNCNIKTDVSVCVIPNIESKTTTKICFFDFCLVFLPNVNLIGLQISNKINCLLFYLV